MRSYRRYKEKANDTRVPFIQPKLNVGKAGDTYEVEADAVADKVVNNTKSQEAIQKMEASEEGVQQKPLAASVNPLVQKQSKDSDEEKVQRMEEEENVQRMEEEENVQRMEEEENVQRMEEEEEVVQTKPDGQSTTSPRIESSLKSSKGGGQGLPKRVKQDMETGFGADFSQVNIHTDKNAVQMNKQLNAQAFTHGNDIYFNQGKYNPLSSDGKHLLAHELAHTIQQKGLQSLQMQQGSLPTAPNPAQAPPQIQVNLNMTMPTVPDPNYDRTANQLGAWEKANFLFTPGILVNCDSTITNGVERSYVTAVEFGFINADFEYFIASHIKENADNTRLPRDERRHWMIAHGLIRSHARTHFDIFSTTKQSVAAQIRADIMTFPTQNRPLRIAKLALKTYAEDTLKYWADKLKYELWRATCDWEIADYPRLSHRIDGATFFPECGNAPNVMPKPAQPRRRRSRRRRTQ